jgi:hypothetical protein
MSSDAKKQNLRTSGWILVGQPRKLDTVIGDTLRAHQARALIFVMTGAIIDGRPTSYAIS